MHGGDTRSGLAESRGGGWNVVCWSHHFAICSPVAARRVSFDTSMRHNGDRKYDLRPRHTTHGMQHDAAPPGTGSTIGKQHHKCAQSPAVNGRCEALPSMREHPCSISAWHVQVRRAPWRSKADTTMRPTSQVGTRVGRRGACASLRVRSRSYVSARRAAANGGGATRQF